MAHKIDAETAKSISIIGLSGVGLIKEAWRSYPADSMSSQTIGLIGKSSQGSTTIKGKVSAYISIPAKVGKISMSGYEI